MGVTFALLACGRVHMDAAHNYAFVTSTVHDPTTFGADLSGADAICNQIADDAGLGTGYLAYLSTSTVTAPSRIGDARGWIRVDGEPFVDRVDDLTAGRLFRPLRVDEHGDDVGTAAGPVATGTDNGGTPTENCGDWTNASMVYAAGDASLTTGGWSLSTGPSCATAARLYCFGTTYDTPLAVTPASGRRAFLTVEAFVPGGGLAAADALCASEAGLAGLSGTFLAMLPTSSATAASRFDLTGPTWVRLDGIPLAESPLAFVAGDLATSLSVTSAGSDFTTTVLTGGDPGQLPDNTACSNWTDPTSAATGVGVADAASKLAFSIDAGACSGDSIYCLEP